MARAVDVLSIVLLVAAGLAFYGGVHALSEQRDLGALFWFAVGALSLRSATDLLAPKTGS